MINQLALNKNQVGQEDANQQRGHTVDSTESTYIIASSIFFDIT